MNEPLRWDIFCRVVDNYGDAGLAWRLARQLAGEYGKEVTLWLDELAVLSRIAPGADPHCLRQRVAGVSLRRWAEPFPAELPAEVVIEAFGCGLPDAYIAAMARSPHPPLWIVLEYLSAEAWIDGAHGLPSPHPRLPLPRRFWFPGFSPMSGGLARERDLLETRDAFRQDRAAQQALWTSLGVPAPARDETRISLFCYPNPALPALLDAWADGDTPAACLVPDGVASGAIDAWTRGMPPRRGRPCVRGRLSLYAIPFVAQDDYDRLLWLCAVNLVRGEDSFVRAQWAGHAFAWHAYPQPASAQWNKIDAFLDRYAAGLDPATDAALRRFWRAWNGAPEASPIGVAWLDFLSVRPHLDRHGAAWAAQLATLPALAAGLVSAASVRV